MVKSTPPTADVDDEELKRRLDDALGRWADEQIRRRQRRRRLGVVGTWLVLGAFLVGVVLLWWLVVLPAQR